MEGTCFDGKEVTQTEIDYRFLFNVTELMEKFYIYTTGIVLTIKFFIKIILLRDKLP